MCAGCPVQAECLAVALAYEIEEDLCWGIWGGVCARDRKQAIQRAKNSGPHAVPDAYHVACQLLAMLDTVRAGLAETIDLGPLIKVGQHAAPHEQEERLRRLDGRIV